MKTEEIFRVNVFQTIAIALGVILVLATARLQILNKGFAESAENSTYEKVTHYPARGMIYDRDSTLMVTNKAVYDIEAVYSKINPSMDTNLFCSLLELEKERFEEMLEKDWKRDSRFSKNVPFVFMSKIPEEIFLRYQEFQYLFPGFQPVLRNVRSYETSSSAHILGYINEVNPTDIAEKPQVYKLGDIKGATGLESYYETLLRGKKGTSFVLKDNVGRKISSYNDGILDTPAISGSDLMLTVRASLQEYAEELLKNKKGAVVAIEPQTGEILALVSAPGYNPDLLSLKNDRSHYYKEISQDSSLPFFNRAIMAKYPPGSIIKPIMALIGLQEGLISEKDRVPCPGVYRYRHFTYGCHIHPSPVNCDQALVHSCNSYFFDSYRKVVEQYSFSQPAPGLNRLSDHLNNFGLGQKLGLDLMAENRGFVPRSDYYDQLYGQGNWRSTYTISLGIGQGELELTTLQMANLAAILANKGHYKKPHLLKAVYNAETDEFE